MRTMTRWSDASLCKSVILTHSTNNLFRETRLFLDIL